MAKPKRKVVIKKWYEGHVSVWYSNISHLREDIESIEGVEGTADVNFSGDSLAVFIDPRYDTDEVMAEIEQLLLAEVPDAFKEALEKLELE